MNELSFSTGLVEYTINGVGSAKVTFNPTDASFVERLYSTFEELDRKQEQYKAEAESATGKREIFDVARKWDQEMRAMIDDVLEASICDTVFGTMNVYAMSDGFPIWANLMLTILDQVDGGFERERDKTSARLEKYTKKYTKKYHK